MCKLENSKNRIEEFLRIYFFQYELDVRARIFCLASLITVTSILLNGYFQ